MTGKARRRRKRQKLRVCERERERENAPEGHCEVYAVIKTYF